LGKKVVVPAKRVAEAKTDGEREGGEKEKWCLLYIFGGSVGTSEVG